MGYTADQVTTILARLKAALAPAKATGRAAGAPVVRRDLTLLLRETRAARSAMTTTQRAAADELLGRVSAQKPTASCVPGSYKVVVSEHFCVRYTGQGLIPGLNPNAATDAWAQKTSQVLEEVYAKEITAMGYRAPRNDGDGRLDVTLENLGGKGYYGYCDAGTGSTPLAYCALDNNFSKKEYGGAEPIDSLRVTAAHEFFHAVQFAYDANDSIWFLEGTATWMEDQVYPEINDYLQYLRKDSQIVRPMVPLDFPGDLERYGSVIFWKYLSERFKDVTIIRKIWESAAASAGKRNGIQAVAAVLRARKTTLAGEFARYGVWNTLPPGTYADRKYFPAPGAWGYATLKKGARDTGPLTKKLDHLTVAPLVLRADASLPTRSKLRVTVDGPKTVRGTAARVQVRYKSGKVLTYAVPLNAAGNGSKAVAFNPRYVKSAIVTLSNGSPSWNAQVFKVRALAVY